MTGGGLTITERAGGVRFGIRVQPRASRAELGGVQDGALRIRITAPPVDDAANDAVIAFLAQLLHVPKRAIRIVSGVTSRRKIVEIEGLNGEALSRLIEAGPL